MRRALALVLLLAQPAQAQTDDRGYLQAFLEDSLSGAGREVLITGFQGALSSQATMESLTIADSDGVWISLTGIKLDWSRSSLLSGEVVINELSAEKIVVARAPGTESDGAFQPEASGFSLPELPVSIEIGRVAAGQIILEEALLGQRVEGSLEAALSLIGGEGSATLDLLRSGDGPEGEITLDASYSNTSRQLNVDLNMVEGKNGLAATLLGLPGAPSVNFNVKGSGRIEDFGAKVQLSTDGTDRLDGTIVLASDATAGARFKVDLAGDLAPLFLPDYADFFGPEVALVAAGTRSLAGHLDLQDLNVRTRSLSLSGKASLASDGLPESFSLKGNLASPDGTPVLLPFGDVPTRVKQAKLAVDFVQANGQGWTGTFEMDGLERPDIAAGRVVLDGSGRIGRTSIGRNFGANLKVFATDLAPKDPGVAAALGSDLTGQVVAHWLEGDGAVSFPVLRIDGTDYSATARLKIEGLREAFQTSGRIDVVTDDLSRFAVLAGRPLKGSGRVSVEGSASRLNGFFDIVAGFAGSGLQVGIAEIDRLLADQSTIDASVIRDETGTTLRFFNVGAKTVTVTGSGKLSSVASDLRGNLLISDLSAFGPGYRGSANLDAVFVGTPDAGNISLEGSAIGLGAGNPQIDRLLTGRNQFRTTLSFSDGEIQLENAIIENPQISLTAAGRVSGTGRQIDLNARLANLAILLPNFPGELRVTGKAGLDDAGYQLDLKANGPGQVDARVSGRLGKAFETADLAISGTGQAALANVFLDPRAISGPVRFDVTLRGPLRLASLSGRVSLSGGRLTDPDLGFSFDRTEAILDLSGGSARTSLTSELSTGGRVRVDGTVGLSAPNTADLGVSLEGVRLVDPELFRTSADGFLRISGPLAGGATISGRIDLAETEIRVPSSGFGGAAGLPDLKHRDEPGAVRETRRKAGLLGGAGGGANSGALAGAYRLDLEISAPNRVFVRGRGIDAELGGGLRLQGTTRAIVPSGGLTLIRGRLDILGKRLALSEASLTLQGDFIPDLLIAASTESDGVQSFVTIAGPADAPVVSFTSVPELPQEEVLSRLLFGRGLSSISALQAAQLANAVAVLAGRGGVGVIGRLRQGFGLDDLDLTTAEDGTTALRAGKYLSDNLYTEIEVDQKGESRINLNLDVRPGVTIKGRVGADGETGIGIFVERDY